MSWDTPLKTGSCHVATCGAGRLFQHPTTKHWTPHSGRCFMPSATAVLKYEKSERDFFGGWSAKGSDVYARVARLRIANLPRAVVSALQSSSPDPIAESEITHEVLNNLEKLKVSTSQQKEILNTLESTLPIPSCGAAVPHAEPEDPIAEEELPQEDPMEIHESSVGEPVRQDKRRKALSLRTEKLGQNPRESRQLLR